MTKVPKVLKKIKNVNLNIHRLKSRTTARQKVKINKEGDSNFRKLSHVFHYSYRALNTVKGRTSR